MFLICQKIILYFRLLLYYLPHQHIVSSDLNFSTIFQLPYCNIAWFFNELRMISNTTLTKAHAIQMTATTFAFSFVVEGFQLQLYCIATCTQKIVTNQFLISLVHFDHIFDMVIFQPMLDFSNKVILTWIDVFWSEFVT